MKRILMITLFAVMAVGCANQSGEQRNDGGVILTVGIEEFSTYLNQQDVRLIDVRTPQEFAESHLAGAENIDVNVVDFTERIADIDGKVAVYCRGGKRSMKAAKRLAAQGCTVYNLDGGIMAWQKAVQPTER